MLFGENYEMVMTESPYTDEEEHRPENWSEDQNRASPSSERTWYSSPESVFDS